MTESRFDQELELRRRLLSHITTNLNEHVIETAVDGLKELLTDLPEYAGELLAPLFERSDSQLEQEPDVSARLLRHIAANLDEELITTAMDALRHFLTCAPEYAEFVMAPMFDMSEYWPQTMAAQLLGLPLDQEYDPDELLDRLENPKGGDS